MRKIFVFAGILRSVVGRHSPRMLSNRPAAALKTPTRAAAACSSNNNNSRSPQMSLPTSIRGTWSPAPRSLGTANSSSSSQLQSQSATATLTNSSNSKRTPSPSLTRCPPAAAATTTRRTAAPTATTTTTPTTLPTRPTLQRCSRHSRLPTCPLSNPLQLSNTQPGIRRHIYSIVMFLDLSSTFQGRQ